MGLNYDSGDSSALQSALAANLVAGVAVLDEVGGASDQLTASVDGGELAGQAYSAVGALFTHDVNPRVSQARRYLESVQKDLEAYTREDSKVSQYGTLREDELDAQLQAVKAQRDATETLIAANSAVAAAATALPGIGEGLQAANHQLEIVLGQLENDIADIQDRLRALREFSAAVAGLFQSDAATTAFAVSAVRTGKTSLAGMDAMQRILSGELTEAEVAREWRRIRDSGLYGKADVKDLPLDVLAKLASTNGIPAWVQHVASKELVTVATRDDAGAQTVYDLLGFGSDGSISVKQFQKNMNEIKTEYGNAVDFAKDMEPEPVVQIVGVGNHDGALVAGISFGNIDTASHLAVTVSGMASSTEDMGNGDLAARALYNDAAGKNGSQSYAVVNWIGYKSPPGMTDAQGMAHADSGAKELAGFLNGINAIRDTAPERFVVYGHSYGTTVTAEALKQIDFDVDLAVMHGSAGLKNDTTKADLHVGKVYATMGPGDNLAHFGYNGPGNQKKLDPLQTDWVTEFSSREKPNPAGGVFEQTTMHSKYAEDTTSTLWNPKGSFGYLNEKSTSLDRSGSLLATGKAT